MPYFCNKLFFVNLLFYLFSRMSDSDDYEDFGSGDESWDDESCENLEIEKQREDPPPSFEDLKFAVIS